MFLGLKYKNAKTTDIWYKLPIIVTSYKMHMNLGIIYEVWSAICYVEKQRWDFTLPNINFSFVSFTSITFFAITYRSLDHTHSNFNRASTTAFPNEFSGGYGEKRCESVTKLRVRSNWFAISRARTYGIVRKILFERRVPVYCACVAAKILLINTTLRKLLFSMPLTYI